jgi:hypothetical protein
MILWGRKGPQTPYSVFQHHCIKHLVPTQFRIYILEISKFTDYMIPLWERQQEFKVFEPFRRWDNLAGWFAEPVVPSPRSGFSAKLGAVQTWFQGATHELYEK